MGRFEQFYHSTYQHPGLLWLGSFVFLGFLLLCSNNIKKRTSSALYIFLVACCALSIVDAWLTSSPPAVVGPLSPPWSSVLPIIFVILGDARYFFILFFIKAGRFSVNSALKALGLALIVPIGSALAHKLLPSEWQQPRTMFLIYELMFFSIAYGLVRVPAFRGISAFVATYYFLWALADVVILQGHDWGYALRVIPNVLYYGGFVPWAYVCLARPSANAKNGS